MRKGFTLIELLAVIVILAVIALIATPIILGIISDSKKSAFKDTAYGIIEAAKNEYIEEMYATQNPSNIIFTYTNGAETSNVIGKSLSYSGAKPNNGKVSLTSEGKVALAIHDGVYCTYKSYDDSDITIEKITWTECESILDNLIASDYDEAKGVNIPRLTQGMIPIKWDGTTWVETTVDDSAWYNYNTTDKQWANAKTVDGSMWVWIPRYAYSISSGYHTNTAGTINIKFLKNKSNIASDNSTVATTPTYSDADTQSNYIVHPSFDFGGTQLTGMWVAKFEMSGTTSSLNSKPGVDPIMSTIIANMFNASRNMETNNKYGWALASGLKTDGTFTTDNNNVDTHMMKNKEWGMVAYLSQSLYGKNAEITKSTSASYYTGGGTGNAYVTNVGQSTTGNINGIYDISGGAWEYVMGSYTNTAGSAGITPSAINGKYIDMYSTSYTASIYGDAVYETSSAIGSADNSWYMDYSDTNSSSPWFVRGGQKTDGDGAGAFSFVCDNGGVRTTVSWRSVILVEKGF